MSSMATTTTTKNSSSPSLNFDLLKDVCKKLSADHGYEEALRFAMSGVQPMKAFMDLLSTVKTVEFKFYGIKATFNWAVYYLNFDGPEFSKQICHKLLSWAPEVGIYVDDLEELHMKIFNEWTTFDRLNKVTIKYEEGKDTYLEPIMTRIFQMPIKNLAVASLAVVPFVDTIVDKEYDSVALLFDNGYFDRLETMLTSYRLHSKNVKLSFTGEYTWYEILYVVSKVVKENNNGAVSTVTENLSLYMDGDIDVPSLPELQLTEFFEDLPKCFPNLKNVYFCLDFTNNAEGLLTEEDASIDLYKATYDEVTKQVSNANIDYNLSVEWIREDHVVDTSSTNLHFTSLCEALTTDMGFSPVDGKEHSWKIETKIAENKNFKMSISLIQPSFEDYDIYEEILHDAGIYFPEHDFDYPSDYENGDYYDDFYDEDEDPTEYGEDPADY